MLLWRNASRSLFYDLFRVAELTIDLLHVAIDQPVVDTILGLKAEADSLR